MNLFPLGQINEDGDRASITFERRFAHPIEKVWAAISDPSELAQWFGKVTSDRKAGGTIVVEAGPEQVPLEVRRSVGKILVWEPPRTLEYEWRQQLVEHSTVRYELRTEGKETVMLFTHRWIGVRNAKGFTPGWHAFFDRLIAYFDGKPVPDWGRRFGELAPQYPSWEGPCAQDGADHPPSS